MSAYNPRKGPVHGPTKKSGLHTCLNIDHELTTASKIGSVRELVIHIGLDHGMSTEHLDQTRGSIGEYHLYLHALHTRHLATDESVPED